MNRKNSTLVFICLVILCLANYSCGPNAKQIAKQKAQDSINVIVKQRQDSIKLITEKEKKGEIIWNNDKHGYFVDIRDSKKYEVVKIESQIIMAVNLAFKPGSGNYWAYNNDQNNISKYGYLYDWETAKKTAPVGWHLPDNEEWKTLYKNLGTDASAVFQQLNEGNNSVPYALLGGWRNTNGEFSNIGTGSFWGTPGPADVNPWRFNYNADGNNTFISGGDSSWGLSVRLIQD